MKKTIFISPAVIKNSPNDFKMSFLNLLNLINHKDVGVVLPKSIGKGQEWYLELIANFERCCDVIDFIDTTNNKDNAYTPRITDFVLIKKYNELAHYEGYISLLDYSGKDYESHPLYTFLPFQTVGRKYLSILATMGFDYNSMNIWIDNYLYKLQSTKTKNEIIQNVAANLINTGAVDIVFPNLTEFINSI